MSTQSLVKPALSDYLWPDFAQGSRYQQALHASLLCVFGSLLIWLSAKIQIPLYPVPITLQTLVVLSIGMVYGWRLGTCTLALYLLEGALGWPVFAGTPERGIGLAYMMGPTGGYLFGFVLAAGLCGYLASRGWDKSPTTTFAAMLLGNLVIYTVGLLWLGSVIGWDKPVLKLGLLPFLVGDVIKIAIATMAFPSLWRWINKRAQ